MRRHGVPGQPEHRRARVRPAARTRRAWRAGWRPASTASCPGAELLEDDPDQVEVADADAAAGQDGVAPLRRPGQRVDQRRLVVADGPEVDAVPSRPGSHEGQERVAVGVADLAGRERAVPREQLVTGGQHADPWAGVHLDFVEALIGQHCRGEPVSGPVPAVAITSPTATSRPGRRTKVSGAQLVADGDTPSVGVRLGLLDHADGVGAVGQRRARHDAGRVARPDGRRRGTGRP